MRNFRLRNNQLRLPGTRNNSSHPVRKNEYFYILRRARYRVES